MNPDQLHKLIEICLNQPHINQWWHYPIWLIVTAIGAFIGTYICEKGKNLATKKDIGKIINEVEKVKSIYVKEVEYIRQRQQLRLAAIDERLRAHQQAYVVLQKLISNVYKPDETVNVVTDCHKWWIDNCLYLAQKPRESLLKAIFSAANLKDFMTDRRNNISLIEENWNIIRQARDEIVRAIELPSLGDDELSFLYEKEPNKLVKMMPNTEQ